tara:strand:+ start:246 stop:458 length:213 start_codon:yes stop_codon:yes gene_type:complete
LIVFIETFSEKVSSKNRNSLVLNSKYVKKFIYNSLISRKYDGCGVTVAQKPVELQERVRFPPSVLQRGEK